MTDLDAVLIAAAILVLVYASRRLREYVELRQDDPGKFGDGE